MFEHRSLLLRWSELGRPEEKASNIGTQENPFGKDRLGNKGMKQGDDTGEISGGAAG